jgi:N-acetylglutamate synthase-like GNAT family acetyltransferase
LVKAILKYNTKYYIVFDNVKNEDLVFRIAEINDIYDIYQVLLESFRPYEKFYTRKSFAATILCVEKIKDRIIKNEYDVYVVQIGLRIVGTVSLKIKAFSSLYIRSMAVHPNFQRHGIGGFILKNINNIAAKNKIKKLILESSSPLENALNFYMRHGFKKTGLTRDFYGVQVYEMIKKID